MNLGTARQLLGIEIHHDRTRISLGQKAYITIILRRLGMEHTHSVSTPINPNEKLDLAEDRGEKELEDITDYKAVVESLMYAALATQPHISFAVTALSRYHSQSFTSHMTTAKRVHQYLKSTADFRLHFNGIGIGIDIGNSLIGHSDSDWANDSVDRKSEGGARVSHQQWSYLTAVWKARSHSHVNSRGLIHRLFRGLQRSKMISPIAKRYSQFKEKLTTAANQLRQSWCSHTYHQANHQSLN